MTRIEEFIPCNDAQCGFMESTAGAVLYSGAFGAGKTRALNEKALFLSVKYPGNFGLICRKTFASLRHTTMRSFFKDACPPDWIEYINKSEHVVRLVGGSEIVFGGLDKPEKWGSAEFGFVAVDEAIEINWDDWTMLEGRLRLASVPFRQIFAATNPGAPSHFLHKRFFEQGYGEVFHAATADNPYLPDDYQRRLGDFKGRYRERYVLGKWVAFEGLVYDLFDPKVHVVDPFPISPDWKRLISIDFGYISPFVCQWWAISPDDRMYLYREIYRSRVLVEKHAERILELGAGEHITAGVSDHDAEDQATLEGHGVKTAPADKALSPGLQAVYSRLDPANPRLFFFRGATIDRDLLLEQAGKPTSTLEEIGGYVWDQNREKPIKENDHGMDAMRYAVMLVEGGLPKPKPAPAMVQREYDYTTLRRREYQERRRR